MALSLTSCGAIGVVGSVYTDTSTPVAVTSNQLGEKVGKAEVTSVLGILATGDASINSAAKSAGITHISHIDVQTKSILGLFTTQTYYVYGY